jgi:Ca2+-binding EF-hand superfamily protein
MRGVYARPPTAWKKMADKETVKRCRALWDEYNVDGSELLDRDELNAIIKRLEELGATAQPFSKTDIEKDGGLSFEEFSAWFLEQEGLPAEFSKPDYTAVGGIARGQKYGLAGSIVQTTSKLVLAPLKKASEASDVVVRQPKKLLDESLKMAVSAGQLAKSIATRQDHHEEASRRAAALLMGERGSLMFAEYVFLMRSGALKKYLPPDWQDRILDYVKLRESFDCADVEGNDQLELEELEMVVLSLNAKAQIEDVGKVWEVLNPEGKDWIDFAEYVAGMLKLRDLPELRGIVPIDIPNRFELLSLLIDSPISQDKEKLIFDKLTWLEKAGVRMLEGMRKPMDRAVVQKTMQQACAGKLHYLTDEQRKKVTVTHWWCVAQALFIGAFFTLWPGMLENYLVATYETDGVFDAYWTCPKRVGDPSAAPWDGSTLPAYYTSGETCTPEILEAGERCSYAGPNGNQLLPATPGEWGVRLEAQCPPGTCTSIPLMNISEFVGLYDGNKAMGGNWTDGDGPCYFAGIPPQKVCYDDCKPLGQTWSHSPDSIKIFWAVNTTGIIIGICFELSLLMYTAVRSAVRVSSSLELRLTPLNADRAFVANMLVRCVIE